MTSLARADYEALLYSLAERYPDISASTLRLYTTSDQTAIVRGSVTFHNGLELRVFEFLDLAEEEILDYSYTLFRGDEKVRWYDPQPHPENLELAPTFPHHFHAPPDIKHNHKPAPGISFSAPNIEQLVKDCIALGG